MVSPIIPYLGMVVAFSILIWAGIEIWRRLHYDQKDEPVQPNDIWLTVDASCRTPAEVLLPEHEREAFFRHSPGGNGRSPRSSNLQ